MPEHHTAEEYLDAYLSSAAIADERKGPLFRSAVGKTDALTNLRLACTPVSVL